MTSSSTSLQARGQPPTPLWAEIPLTLAIDATFSFNFPNPSAQRTENRRPGQTYATNSAKRAPLPSSLRNACAAPLQKIKEENLTFIGDLGFRVFKLDTTNIREWEPAPDDIEAALFDNIDHIKGDRSEQDILYELLLKLGLDLCVPVETLTIAGKLVHAVGAGTLIACLDETITRAEVEPLALGIADWHEQLAPAGETTIVFRDNAFTDDVAKTNLAAILEQHGLGTVRSL